MNWLIIAAVSVVRASSRSAVDMGSSTLLRGLKTYTRNLTAIVTVADDGGRPDVSVRRYGILPPGDIRNCLAALSNDEQMLTQLFRYRFSGSGGLDGHSFGNLFITALTDITGSFEEAIAESGKVLSVSGRVLPSTLHDVKLVADMQLPNSPNQVRVQGESRIPKMAGRVRRVWLEPNDAPAFPPALKAILKADPDRCRTRKPVYEPPAQPACTGSAWRDQRQPRPEGLRLQYRNPVR